MDMHDLSIYQSKANQVATSGNDEAKVGCMVRRWYNSPKSCVQEGIKFEHRQIIREQMVALRGEWGMMSVRSWVKGYNCFDVAVLGVRIKVNEYLMTER